MEVTTELVRVGASIVAKIVHDFPQFLGGLDGGTPVLGEKNRVRDTRKRHLREKITRIRARKQLPQCNPVRLAKNRSLLPARPWRPVFLGAGDGDGEFVYDSGIDDPRPSDQRVVVSEIVIVKREREVVITEDPSPALGIGPPLLQA